ncbi:rhamnan synthesis F family protein [Ruegeria atlantica]|uniref:Vi polysaccharide biosynthesis protein TviE n=1 Tax=Ruegeria atlantica TaxID=81569 RepID=A0A0P1EHH8_9RHOB|nr:rhamnan synthesis F family protein [Ruegeria atlantica]CUH49840.1 Vi polysaccharide biosynthesis protein TviE [Ruegeria atlantica]
MEKKLEFFGLRSKRKARRARQEQGAEKLSSEEAIVDKSGLFDKEWYAAEYPEAVNYPRGMLAHYFDLGAEEGKDPNSCFSTSWYLSAYPEAEQSGMNPLYHYIVFGANAGCKPNEFFNPSWYAKNYPDAGAGGKDALLHFMNVGQSEGRRCNPTDKSTDVKDVEIKVLKRASSESDLALFVTHAPAGKIKPHVPVYIDALRRTGIAVVVIVVANCISDVDTSSLLNQVDGLILRENGGFDFAAWAHALNHIDLESTRMLCLVNDSLIGPLWKDGLDSIVNRARESEADLVGLTDNFEFKHHLQSFFLVAKGNAVEALVDFLGGVRNLDDKQEVIFAYELQLTDALKAKGFQAAALFPNKGTTNRTIKDWQGLIEEGFPFVKTAVIQDPDTRGWEGVFAKLGYDVAIAKKSIELIKSGDRSEGAVSQGSKMTLAAQNFDLSAKLSKASADRRAALARVVELERELMLAAKRPLKQVRRKLKFKIYKSLAKFSPPLSQKTASNYQRRAVKYDPKRFLQSPVHFEAAATGRAGGKGSFEFRGDKVYDDSKPNVLVVSHQASRSGAPILTWNVTSKLSTRYNVTTLCLTGGEITGDFRKVSEKVFDANLQSTKATDYTYLLNCLCTEREYAFAVVNSIQSHALLKGLHECGVPSVALLHEFASYIEKKTAFSEAVRWADETVFSTRLTLENALELDKGLMDMTPNVTVLPQGRCSVPNASRDDTTVEAERSYLRELIRPSSEQTERFVVLGAGTVEIRKGVDLFLETATRVLQSSESNDVHFVWIGPGYDPDKDFGYSVYLRDQLQRAGLEQRVTMVPSISEMDVAYEMSDVFLVTSRLDPLPNVAIDSMCAGLPVLCFEEASGVADLLIDEGLGEDCVAQYIDTGDMAGKLLRLATTSELYESVSKRTREVAARVFDLSAYVNKLEELGLAAKARHAARERDITDIVESGFFRPDYFLSDEKQNRDSKTTVGTYVDDARWGATAKKPEPGFHPFVYDTYLSQTNDRTRDAYAHFISEGRPEGPWRLPVLEGGQNTSKKLEQVTLQPALHIHAYHLDQMPEIVSHLSINKTLPDLYVSVGKESDENRVKELLSNYNGRLCDVRSVPNAGRDIGPLLTQFGEHLCNNYDVVGHIHLKKSTHVKDQQIVHAWSKFLFENLLGGRLGGNMADKIFERFQVDEKVGLIYPDDPHVMGWSRNIGLARRLAKRLGHNSLPAAFNFPVGTMFWMRSDALKSFVDLGFNWSDYPKEPVAVDGTMLHALERLFGVIPEMEGWRTVVTNIHGVTR